jgi:hypothetical protein
MAKNRQTESVEKRIGRNTTKTYIQVVHTAPARVLVGTYLTKKGKKLMSLAKTDKEKKDIRAKYEKNRYAPNPECHVFLNKNGRIRKIKHT